ncbi:hypothetical protein PAPYR_5158 [Paratrimastix pyriformis]|uniref:Uncharacterized protein n=1 Tax=Paratrimastix pyriformis TaxID=342808 RepID=A0ABQ8UI33_9EUKA|nr:hypothetical protein PAPYR_5158 [Paratrimastix pyriformis]
MPFGIVDMGFMADLKERTVTLLEEAVAREPRSQRICMCASCRVGSTVLDLATTRGRVVYVGWPHLPAVVLKVSADSPAEEVVETLALMYPSMEPFKSKIVPIIQWYQRQALHPSDEPTLVPQRPAPAPAAAAARPAGISSPLLPTPSADGLPARRPAYVTELPDQAPAAPAMTPPATAAAAALSPAPAGSPTVLRQAAKTASEGLPGYRQAKKVVEPHWVEHPELGRVLQLGEDCVEDCIKLTFQKQAIIFSPFALMGAWQQMALPFEPRVVSYSYFSGIRTLTDYDDFRFVQLQTSREAFTVAISTLDPPQALAVRFMSLEPLSGFTFDNLVLLMKAAVGTSATAVPTAAAPAASGVNPARPLTPPHKRHVEGAELSPPQPAPATRARSPPHDSAPAPAPVLAPIPPVSVIQVTGVCCMTLQPRGSRDVQLAGDRLTHTLAEERLHGSTFTIVYRPDLFPSAPAAAPGVSTAPADPAATSSAAPSSSEGTP